MTSCLVIIFALLGIAAAAQFSVPLRKSASLRQKMVKESRYSEYLVQRKIQQLKSGKQNLFDTMDEFYLADITLGTPDQHFTVSIDTTSSIVWVLDVNCDSENCHGGAQNFPLKETYNNSDSSTFQDYNKNFLFPYAGSEVYGLLGKEKVSFAGFTLTNQDFIRATVVPDIYTVQPVDGVLGLGWPDQQELRGVGTPMQALLSQLDQPIFSIWMQRTDTATMGSPGAITYGGFDSEACDKDISYVSLAQPGVWGFFVERSSIGAFRRTKNETAISDSSSGWTGVPYEVFSQILKTTKAKYDWINDAYTVPCSTTENQPDLNLNIGGNIYTIKSINYVLDLGFNNGQCALSFFTTETEKADWILGEAFIRGYCHVYDFGNSRIGLSKFVKRD